MKLSRNWVVAAVAGVLVPAAIAFASFPSAATQSAGTVINCLVQGACNVAVDSRVAAPSSSDEKFGANAWEVTRWTSGEFDDDLQVDDSLTVTGTTTLNGLVSGVPKALEITMSSSATTTACSSLNNSGLSRTVVAVGVVDRGTAASTGSVTWVSGTSSYPGVAPTVAGVNTAITRASGVDIITTTSTMLGSSGAYTQWRNGEYFNFVAGTTTNAGTCEVIYY